MWVAKLCVQGEHVLPLLRNARRFSIHRQDEVLWTHREKGCCMQQAVYCRNSSTQLIEQQTLFCGHWLPEGAMQYELRRCTIFGRCHTSWSWQLQTCVAAKLLPIVAAAVVGRGNVGWTTSKSGHTCPCQNCSHGPSAEKTGRGSLLNRPSYPFDDHSVKGLN